MSEGGAMPVKVKKSKSIQATEAIKPMSKEHELSAEYISKHNNCPPKVKAVSSADGAIGLAPACTDNDFLMGTFEALGTNDSDLLQYFLRQASGSACEGPLDQNTNTALAMLHGISPKDPLESMLALQMIRVHGLAMEYTRRAGLAGQTTEGVDLNVNRATKLMRTFTAQMEALNRHRGKGQQSVTVKHVHVNNGGQAVIGSVTGGRDE